MVPLASGSIAQIHVATLAARKGNSNGSAASSEGGGRKVAVKVQHPGDSLSLRSALICQPFCACNRSVEISLDSFPLISVHIGDLFYLCLHLLQSSHPDLASALELDMAILRWCGNALGDRVAQTVDQFAVNFEAQLDLRDEVQKTKNEI